MTLNQGLCFILLKAQIWFYNFISFYVNIYNRQYNNCTVLRKNLRQEVTWFWNRLSPNSELIKKKQKKKHHTDIKMKIFSLGLILSKGKVGVTSGGQLSQLRLVIWPFESWYIPRAWLCAWVFCLHRSVACSTSMLRLSHLQRPV